MGSRVLSPRAVGGSSRLSRRVVSCYSKVTDILLTHVLRITSHRSTATLATSKLNRPITRWRGRYRGVHIVAFDCSWSSTTDVIEEQRHQCLLEPRQSTPLHRLRQLRGPRRRRQSRHAELLGVVWG